MALGAHGHIDFHRDPASGRVHARARLRGYDGVCRAVTRWAATRSEAESRLLEAWADQTVFLAGDWTGGTRVAAAIGLWRADLEASSLSPATRQLYEAAARLYVQPALGGVRLVELTPAVIDRALTLVQVNKGTQPARAARRALSSLCADAVRHSAMGHNPVRDTRPIPCEHRQARALTPAEAADLQARLAADPRASRLDLPDLVQFMLGTGVRIGEAAAVRDAVLDLTAGTVHINATVIRVPGVGLRVQPRTKTTASRRILALPAPVLATLRDRRAAGRPT